MNAFMVCMRLGLDNLIVKVYLLPFTFSKQEARDVRIPFRLNKCATFPHVKCRDYAIKLPRSQLSLSIRIAASSVYAYDI